MMNKRMTKQRLEQYRALNREIAMLTAKLGEARIVADSVQASSKELPYRKRTVIISGIDEQAIKRIGRKRAAAYTERKAIEEYIDGIGDSLIRIIMEERYIWGKSWSQVARVAGGNNTGESVRKAAMRFLSG